MNNGSRRSGDDCSLLQWDRRQVQLRTSMVYVTNDPNPRSSPLPQHKHLSLTYLAYGTWFEFSGGLQCGYLTYKYAFLMPPNNP